MAEQNRIKLAGEIRAALYDRRYATPDGQSKEAAAIASRGYVVAARLENGYYDEFTDGTGGLATPDIVLRNDLIAANLPELAQRVVNGEFDATKEESEAWAARQKHTHETKGRDNCVRCILELLGETD